MCVYIYIYLSIYLSIFFYGNRSWWKPGWAKGQKTCPKDGASHPHPKERHPKRASFIPWSPPSDIWRPAGGGGPQKEKCHGKCNPWYACWLMPGTTMCAISHNVHMFLMHQNKQNRTSEMSFRNFAAFHQNQNWQICGHYSGFKKTAKKKSTAKSIDCSLVLCTEIRAPSARTKT